MAEHLTPIRSAGEPIEFVNEARVPAASSDLEKADFNQTNPSTDAQDEAEDQGEAGTATAFHRQPSAAPSNTSHTIYTRFTPAQKAIIMSILCYCGFLTPIASTAILVAIPEVAATLHTSGVIISVSNGLFFVFMAVSPIFWGPLAQTGFGRRGVFVVSSVLLTAFSAGTAAAPEVGSYFVFRMLTAFQGTAYLVVGSVVIGDVYHPRERGRALSVFMSGILIGPSVAPLLGGVVITYTSWRVIYWVITGLSGLSSVLVILFLPETMHERPDTFKDLTVKQSIVKLAKLTSPWKVIHPLLAYPNLWIAALAVSSMIWNQYSLLTPIRYVINPRFNLTTPIQSALFFLPPGIGYFCGVFFGGSWSDFVVARYIKKRNGRRVPEDRLNSAVPLMAVFIPGFMVLYGWAIEKEIGGIPLVVISMFMQGFTQQIALPSINTYLIDVFQDKGESGVAVAGNYFSRFMFAAAGTAACLPAIRAIGVGWFSTVSALFISVSAFMVWLLTRYGEQWRLKTGSS